MAIECIVVNSPSITDWVTAISAAFAVIGVIVSSIYPPKRNGQAQLLTLGCNNQRPPEVFTPIRAACAAGRPQGTVSETDPLLYGSQPTSAAVRPHAVGLCIGLNFN